MFAEDGYEFVANPAPFDVPIPADSGHRLKMVAGVMHVYRDDDALARDEHESLDWLPSIKKEEFLADQNLLFALIADGPL